MMDVGFVVSADVDVGFKAGWAFVEVSVCSDWTESVGVCPSIASGCVQFVDVDVSLV